MKRLGWGWSVGCVAMCVLALGALRADDTQSTAAPADGWQSLFNGQDLSGWQSNRGNIPDGTWIVEDGVLKRLGRGGDLYTAEAFGDFQLEFEFLTKGNSGLLFRKADPRTSGKDRLEIQILPPSRNPSRHTCGSLYDCVAPSEEACKAGEWNHMVLTSTTERVKVVLNGKQVLDVDLTEFTEKGKNPDGSSNKFTYALSKFPAEGHIGFQDHGNECHYRNIRIKRLDSNR